MSKEYNQKFLITGATGMLGSHILELALANQLDVLSPKRDELNLFDVNEVSDYLIDNQVTSVIHCAAQVGGIQKNIDDPAGFLNNNLKIDMSMIWSAERHKIREFIYFGSSCMYPRECTQPMEENQILSGELEPTNESYALAKIVASELVAKLGQQLKHNWRVLILSNLYGPRDNFEESSSHLVAAIIRKISEAKNHGLNEVEIWGDGKARREFTYVSDVAKFVVEEIQNIDKWPLMMNLGYGKDYSIFEFYKIVADSIGYTGRFRFNPRKPTGMHQKLLNSNVARNYNWVPKTSMIQGIEETIRWYTQNRRS